MKLYLLAIGMILALSCNAQDKDNGGVTQKVQIQLKNTALISLGASTGSELEIRSSSLWLIRQDKSLEYKGDLAQVQSKSLYSIVTSSSATSKEKKQGILYLTASPL